MDIVEVAVKQLRELKERAISKQKKDLLEEVAVLHINKLKERAINKPERDLLEEVAVLRINELYEEVPIGGTKETFYNELPLWVTGGLSPFELMQKNDPIAAREAVLDEIDNMFQDTASANFDFLDSLVPLYGLADILESLEYHGYGELYKEYREHIAQVILF